MQPNNQQGSNQPGQNQPVPSAPQPAVLPQPVTPAQAPTSSPVQLTVTPPGPAQPIDQNALQAALAETVPQPVATPQPAAATPDSGQLAEDEDGEEADVDLDAPVSWVAHEYIHQEKGTLWFALFGVIVVALIAVSIFLMHSWSFAILMAVIAVVVIVYSRRPPRELTYSLDDDGLTIDGKLHIYSEFKSFGVIQDGEHYSVMLIPTQRFQPSVTVYFPEEVGEDIVDILGSRLPMKDLKLDAVDRAVRLLRL